MDSFQQKLEEWLDWKEKLALAKQTELMLRNEICEAMFDGRTGSFQVEGSYAGYAVKATSRTTLKMDETILNDLWEHQELTGEEVACIQTKLTFKPGALNKIPKNRNIWKAFTEQPATPTLEVKVT